MPSKTQNWNVVINLTVDNFKYNYDLTSSENGIIILLDTMKNQLSKAHVTSLGEAQFTEAFKFFQMIFHSRLEEYQGEFVQIRKV